MRIAIDYDDTFTADPVAWCKVIQVLEDAGHEVVCVTSRFETYDNQYNLEAALPNSVQVVLCDHNAKAEVMKARGMPVDIWIDDDPYTIDPDGNCHD